MQGKGKCPIDPTRTVDKVELVIVNIGGSPEFLKPSETNYFQMKALTVKSCQGRMYF